MKEDSQSMKRIKEEIRNIGLTLIIMGVVVVAMFMIVHIVGSICDEQIVNNASSQAEQELSKEELYKNGFMVSQKITAVEIIIENLRNNGKISDKQYEKFYKTMEALFNEVIADGKISKRTREQFNKILNTIWKEDDYSYYFKKEELILTEEWINVEAIEIGLIWLEYRRIIEACHLFGMIDRETYKIYVDKEEEYYIEFTSKWQIECAEEFFQYSCEVIMMSNAYKDKPNIFKPDLFKKEAPIKWAPPPILLCFFRIIGQIYCIFYKIIIK